MKIFCISLLTSLLCYLPAQALEDYYQVSKDQAKIRIDSTVNSKVLGAVGRGQKIKVVGERFNWYRVALPENIPCYIYKELTQKVAGNKIQIIANEVNLRSDASLESPVIGQVSKNQVFSLIEDQGQWLKVENNSKAYGWIHKQFLKAQKPARDLGFLESQLGDATPETIYPIISELTQIGKNNPAVTVHFLEKAKSSPLKEASIYLDILQNILRPEGEAKAYFYLAQNNSLSTQELKNALALFEEIVQKAITN